MPDDEAPDIDHQDHFKPGGINHAFILAARHVAASPKARIKLIEKVKELAGDTTADRQSLHTALVPFFEDFGNSANGSGITPNEKIEYIYSEIAANRIAWPIKSLLAWLSYNFSEDT